VSARLPLIDRIPALDVIPRARLGTYPTPVQPLASLAPGLWIKRDDLSGGGGTIGGNKTRALEFLLGGVRRGDRVVTMGSEGSTHALSTAVHARALGARVSLGLWRQEMNPTAEVVARHLARISERRRVFALPPTAIAWALIERWRGAHWIPMGGTSPLGALGHVNAALELAEQIGRGEMPEPKQVFVPLGTGGTAAGLVLGFRLAGLATTVVGVRVVTRAVARRGRVVGLARATARLIARHTDRPMPHIQARDIEIVHEFYGGAYARDTEAGARAQQLLAEHTGIALDATYTAKAFAAFLEHPRPATHNPRASLFWLTFDGRVLTTHGDDA
jgi:D-cysteine desulfhydrase